jgi:hypothetical protein
MLQHVQNLAVRPGMERPVVHDQQKDGALERPARHPRQLRGFGQKGGRCGIVHVEGEDKPRAHVPADSRLGQSRGKGRPKDESEAKGQSDAAVLKI